MAKDIKDMNSDTSFDGMGDMSGDSDWDINIDQLLEQADMLVKNDMLPPMPEFEEESSKREAGIGTGAGVNAKANAAEVEPKTDGTENKSGTDEASSQSMEMDSDLDEINSLLEQADLNEKVDDDMLALLESATENQEDADNPDEVFDIFADGDMPMEDMKSSGVPEQTEEEGETDKKKKREKKKKVKKNKKASADDNKDGKKEKKPGFLAKITALLGGGDDFDEEGPDTAADENIQILNELNGEEGKKPSKKGKKKKENDKGKKNPKEAKSKANSKAKAKVKEKKPAAAKKKKEKPVEKSAEKPVKILNGKSFAAIAGLCFSIIAGVMIVTTFLPEYADKQTARKAFRDGDYETVYKLFYDKKLSTDEELLFYQSKVIRQMERRLEAYENNITMGRELEAVDALMRGVENYQDLWEADEYQVRNEVDALYGQICGILESNYGISREEAVTIASYDKIEYTKALYTILGGTGISFEEEDTAAVKKADSDGESAGEDGVSGDGDVSQPDGILSDDTSLEDTDNILPDDMLPAEEDIMN